MNGPSRKSSLTISDNSPSATFSPASESGATASGSLDGKTLDLFGREVAPVRVSAVREKAKGLMTLATSGHIGIGSSGSVGLQSCLENRLMTRLDTAGSTLFTLRWKRRRTPLGRRYLERAASVRRISGSVSTLSHIPSPAAQEPGGSLEAYRERNPHHDGGLGQLAHAAQLSGLPSPTANPATYTGGNAPGYLCLPGIAQLVPVPTTTSADIRNPSYPESVEHEIEKNNLRGIVHLSAVPTTTRQDSIGARRHGYMYEGHQGTTLTDAANLSSVPSPNQGDRNCSGTRSYSEKRLTRENACSQLADVAQALSPVPTPCASEDNKSVEAHLAMKRRMGERDGTGAERRAITSLQVTAKLAPVPTPQVHDKQGPKTEEQLAAMKGKGHGVANLNETVLLSAVPTPKALDENMGFSSPEMADREINRPSSGSNLPTIAQLSSVVSPQEGDARRGGVGQRYLDKNHAVRLNDQVMLASVMTPSKSDGEGGPTRKPEYGTYLKHQVTLASVSTPTVIDSGKRGSPTPTLKRGLAEVSQLASVATPRNEDSQCAGAHRGVTDTLHSQAELASVCSPIARDHHPNKLTGRNQVQLAHEAELATVATPNISHCSGRHRGVPDTLHAQAKLSAVRTPKERDHHPSHKDGYTGDYRTDLGSEVKLATTATPTVRDWKDTGDLSQSNVRKDGKTRLDVLPRQALLADSGPDANGGGEETASGGQLNPEYSRWLLGLPTVFSSCADTAMQSWHRLPRSSSKPPQRR